ncbi:haloalkane dehalogenase [Puia dinghuensis]|uniref:Haloalkane dehalogenase n=1 Tax=Puia dinghuensis TaxID=1792502 RepID=A0A8J2UDI8_9BACT|nr:haloalkane dehalogenase [Puia dinghuensis]GGB02663.1 haloalkane dehalogenase [Puia dinghuensis]
MKQFQIINGLKMAYVEAGQGDPIVFLHGNPTSSYIWRNIIPYVEGMGRVIAPDLIGMGDSEKLPDSNGYTFFENRKYLDALLDALDVKRDIIFVVHDWGSALGFDWARRHPGAVKGIVYMEAIIQTRSWSELSPTAQQIFQALRSEKGEDMVLRQNSFIEFNLPKSILRPLSKEEHDEYRRPFLEPGEGRRPMLSWARQLPIEGEPADVVKVVDDYGDFMAHSPIPKLFIESSPGALSAKEREFCRTWPNQTEVTVNGHHHLQEDAPDAIGEAIAAWITTVYKDLHSGISTPSHK